MRAALNSLSEEVRTVVLLHKFDGLSMNEIAETVGISAGAARVRAHRGYKAIGEYIEEHRS